MMFRLQNGSSRLSNFGRTIAKNQRKIKRAEIAEIGASREDVVAFAVGQAGSREGEVQISALRVLLRKFDNVIRT